MNLSRSSSAGRSAGSDAWPRRRQINGAGATFPYPIYSKWFSEYNKLHPTVQINYQSLGSGAGIRQLTSRTVFFGATDGPMTPDQLRRRPGRSCIFRPCSARSCPVYNIPGRRQELKFTGPVLADIFLGQDHEMERSGRSPG